MSLNDTPQGERTHIAFFGLRNAGKSSLLNAVANQNLSIVSPISGTTTDPVQKAMEILPLGPCLLIDTPGLDDVGDLGLMRVQKAMDALSHTDLAVVVSVAGKEISAKEEEFLSLLKEKNIPSLHIYTKCDTLETLPPEDSGTFYVSAKSGYHIAELKELMAKTALPKESRRVLIRDLLPAHAEVLLVIPIDSSAPKGRLILPQQQVIRDLLEGSCTSIVASPEEIETVLSRRTPDLVVTDSQVFDIVAKKIPSRIPLTSFSILMARYKGYLEEAVKGVSHIERLSENDTILVAEGCSHHRQCEDIGTVKIPRWLTQKTQKKLHFVATQGRDFPKDLSPYALVVLCGGCMLNAKEVSSRVESAIAQKKPVTNYGILIAAMRGILARSLEIFPNLHPLIV